MMRVNKLNNSVTIYQEIVDAFKYAWMNQGKIFRILACPILFLVIYHGIQFFMSFMSHGSTQLIDPTGNPVPTNSMVGENLNITGIFLNFISSLALLLALIMMSVRLYRFMLVKNDNSPMTFFTLGKREWRTFGYQILTSLVFFIPAIIGVAGAVAIMVYFFLTPIDTIVTLLEKPEFIIVLSVFLIPAEIIRCLVSFTLVSAALDRSTGVRKSWKQFKGVYGRFILIMLPVIVLNAVLNDPSYIKMYFTTTQMPLVVMYAQPAIVIYSIWIMIFMTTVTSRIMANFYQRQVLDME